MWALLLLSCASEGQPPQPPAWCDDEGNTDVYVIRALSFMRQDAGTSDGFDLDGIAGASCGIADFAAPDGQQGIDNAFAYLLPALELTEAAAVESLIQQAIENGNLLITLALGEVDHATDDPCVDLTVGRAVGQPLVGSDGRLLEGQTFDRDPDNPEIVLDAIPMIAGVVQGPLTLTLPVTVFDVDLNFTLNGGQARVSRHDDGLVTGMFAGGVDVAYILQVAAEENVDANLHGILDALLSTWADLDPDAEGDCQRISITFGFEAVPAFFFG